MWFLFKKAEKFEKRKITLHFKHKHKSYTYTDEAVLASVCWNFVHFFRIQQTKSKHHLSHRSPVALKQVS